MTRARTKRPMTPPTEPPAPTCAQRLLAHIHALNPAEPLPPNRLSHLHPPGDPAWAETRKVYLTWSPHHDDRAAAQAFGRDLLLVSGPNGGVLFIEDNALFLREDADPAITAYLQRLLRIAKGEPA